MSRSTRVKKSLVRNRDDGKKIMVPSCSKLRAKYLAFYVEPFKILMQKNEPAAVTLKTTLFSVTCKSRLQSVG